MSTLLNVSSIDAHERDNNDEYTRSKSITTNDFYKVVLLGSSRSGKTTFALKISSNATGRTQSDECAVSSSDDTYEETIENIFLIPRRSFSRSLLSIDADKLHDYEEKVGDILEVYELYDTNGRILSDNNERMIDILREYIHLADAIVCIYRPSDRQSVIDAYELCRDLHRYKPIPITLLKNTTRDDNLDASYSLNEIVNNENVEHNTLNLVRSTRKQLRALMNRVLERAADYRRFVRDDPHRSTSIDKATTHVSTVVSNDTSYESRNSSATRRRFVCCCDR